MGEHKFKVGDRVRLLADEDKYRPAGSIGIVRDVSSENYLTVDFEKPFDGWGDTNSWNISPRLIEPAPLFAVGDRVRVARNSRESWLNSEIGKEFTITHNDGPDNKDWTGDISETEYWWPSSDLELVPTPTPTTGFTVPLEAPEFANDNDEPDGKLQVCNLEIAYQMVQTGVCTINEVRKILGLPTIASGHHLAAA